MTWILLLWALTLQGQDLAGYWTGVLVHRSCLGSTRSLGVLLHLSVDPKGGVAQWTGTLRYYAQGIVSAADSLSKPTLLRFAVRARQARGQLMVSYSAADELDNRQGALAYYIMGQYSLVLAIEPQRLKGFYGGSNGGRGEIYFTRPQPIASADSLGLTFARLRARLANGQGVANAPKADTVQAFALLAADTTLLATQRKKATRSYDTAHTLYVGAVPFVEVSLYDNAVEDGDTVSLFANRQLVAHRIGLSGQPKLVRLYKPTDSGTTLLTMVAENLGSIPPNTAWMVIEAAQGVRHTLRLASSDTQSGSLLIRWQ